MTKIAIIGLGLIGNSMGMAIKKNAANAQSVQIVGFDPDRKLEELALRQHASVDEIAPDLERAVRGAQIVVIATPPSAVREVLAAIDPFLEEGATVTDALPYKEQVMAWAGELLSPRVSFVGGHPFSRTVDLGTAAHSANPSADLFLGAPYCIMPAPSASNESLSRVIGLAETIGAEPRFLDPREHDSFMAATTHLPVAASAALMRVTTGSPAWSDMSGLAHGDFRSMADPLSADPVLLSDAIHNNRQSLVRWLDAYLIAVQEIRDLLAEDDRDALLTALTELHEAQTNWANPDAPDSPENRQRAELQQAINDSRPSRNLMGTYLTERLFRRRDRDNLG
jgi:prephenate dehydrogenase